MKVPIANEPGSRAESTKGASSFKSNRETLVFHAFIIPAMWEIPPLRSSDIEMRGSMYGGFSHQPVTHMK